MDMSGILKNIVSITQFNKGKASQLFTRACAGNTLVVVRNNSPVAVVVSPKEYELLQELLNTCQKAVGRNDDFQYLQKIETVVAQIKALDEKR